MEGNRTTSTGYLGLYKMNMKKNLLAIGVVALVTIALSSTEAEAGRYRQANHSHMQSHRTVYSNARYPMNRRVYRYPRTRQVDGRSHWDLGKQNGQWPSF